jgi:hypothetical protein
MEARDGRVAMTNLWLPFLFLTTTPVPVLDIICVFHSRVNTMPSPLLLSTLSFLPLCHSSLSLARLVRCSESVHRFLGNSFQLPTMVAIQPFVSAHFLLSLCYCIDNCHFALRLTIGLRPGFTSLWFLSDHEFWLFLLGISLQTHGD